MGAKKGIDVSGTTKNTAALTAGADETITGFRLASAGTGGTFLTNYITLKDGSGNPISRTLSADGTLKLDDAGIWLSLGVAGSNVDGQHSDAQLIAGLDAMYPTGASGLYLAWCKADKSESTRLARTSVDAWLAAQAF